MIIRKILYLMVLQLKYMVQDQQGMPVLVILRSAKEGNENNQWYIRY
jgi:hypothetical protein